MNIQSSIQISLAFKKRSYDCPRFGKAYTCFQTQSLSAHRRTLLIYFIKTRPVNNFVMLQKRMQHWTPAEHTTLVEHKKILILRNSYDRFVPTV